MNIHEIKCAIDTGNFKLVNGFYYEAFITYVKSTWDVSFFAIDMIHNIIHYALEHKNVSKDQFAEFVSDIIPETEFYEVAAFCDDGQLTSYGISEKARFWKEEA